MLRPTPFKRKTLRPKKEIDKGALLLAKEEERFKGFYEELVSEHEASEEVMQATYQTKINDLEKTIKELDSYIEVVKGITESIKEDHSNTVAILKKKLEAGEFKGEKGDAGENGDTPVIDTEAIIKEVSSKIKQPKDGETPIIDIKTIAKEAAKLVKVTIPKVEAPTIDLEAIHDGVIDKIIKGKKLKADHVEGLNSAMQVLRNFVANGSRHGGGDTVAAGNGITLTRNSNGTTTITSAPESTGTTTFTYNADGSLNKVTTPVGTKTMGYTAGVLTSIVGTGSFRSKTFTYSGEILQTKVTS